MLHKYNLSSPITPHVTPMHFINYLRLYCALRYSNWSLKGFGVRKKTLSINQKIHISCLVFFLNKNLPKLINYVKITAIEMFSACRCIHVKFLSACHPFMKLIQGLVSWWRAQKTYALYVCAHHLCQVNFQLLHLQGRMLREASTNSASHVTCGWTCLWAYFLLCWGCWLCPSQLCPCKLKLCSWPVNLAPLAPAWALTSDWGAVCADLGSV